MLSDNIKILRKKKRIFPGNAGGAAACGAADDFEMGERSFP